VNPGVRVILLLACWALWFAPFAFQRKPGTQAAAHIDSRARWGIALEAGGFFVANTHGPEFWNSPLEPWRAFIGVLLALLATAVAWSAVRNLGRQWRVDAGLNANHELVQTGAYRFVRHPIYASMFAMLLTSLALVGTLPGWPVALVLFAIGTEIRVRVEDRLLRERFGEKFLEWRRRVPAYVPFVR